MKSKETIINFNDEMVDLIKEYVTEEIEYNELKICKNVLVVCSGVYTKMNNLLNIFEKYNQQANLFFLGNEDVIEKLLERNGEMNYYAFNGKFRTELWKGVKRKRNGMKFDSVIYVCKYAVDVRDLNIIELAENVNNEEQIELFSFASGEMLNRYKEIGKYKRSLMLYHDFIGWLDECICGD